MNQAKMGQFQRDLEQLMKNHTVHPMLIVFSDDDRKTFFATAGNPSIEWISRSCSSFMSKQEENMKLKFLFGGSGGF